jgi:hypothetical protein
MAGMIMNGPTCIVCKHPCTMPVQPLTPATPGLPPAGRPR